MLLLLAAYVAERGSRLDLDVGFLTAPAGFQISHNWIVTFDSSDSRLVAYLVAVSNTVRLVVVVIVFATMLTAVPQSEGMSFIAR